MEVRQYLVESLLCGPDPLPELQSVLANDEIEVAQAVLERSKVLQDQDLIDVVLRRAEEHRMAIALRNDVSAAVAEALVEKAGPDVIEALIRNPDATLSRRAMEMLVAESKRRSEEHTSELQSLMRISYAVFCLKKKKHISGYQ